MMIMVAGPYSAETERERAENLEALNRVAAQVLVKGHIPIVGLNAALPVIAKAEVTDQYKAIMEISLALAEACDGVLMVGESPGANRERAVLERKGRPVYFSVDEIPERTRAQ